MENPSITRSKLSSDSYSNDKSTDIKISLSSSNEKDELMDDNDNFIDDADLFNSSLTCCDCNTYSSEYKKFKAKKLKTLKSIIGYLDDPKHRACDFKIPDDLYKEVIDIIKNLFSIKCKAQNLYNTIISHILRHRPPLFFLFKFSLNQIYFSFFPNLVLI